MGHGTEHPGLDTLDVSDPGQVFELTDQPVPGLAVNARRAADGGWDFEVTLTNFGIMEGDAPAEALGNSGHVHMFVNGEFSARLDGNAIHLAPSGDFIHEVAIGLITHDDRFISRDGRLILERFVVLEPRSEPDGDGEAAIIDIAVAAGVDAETVQVRRGDVVMLRWAVDAPMELHLHGYDVEAEVAPASPAAMLFIAEFAGRFAVEAHLEDGGERAVLFLEGLP